MNQDPANSLSPNATVSAQTNNQPTQQVAAPASYAAPQAASTASSLNMAPAKVAAAAGVESEAEAAAAVDSTAAQYSTVGSVHLQNAPAATNNTDRAAGSSVVTSSAAISIVVNTPAPNSAAKSAESTNLAPLAQTEHSTLPTAAAAAACPLHFPPRPLPPQQDAEPLSPQESTPQVPSSLLQPLYSWRQLPRSEQEFFLLLNRELNANSMAVVNLAPIPLLKSDYYRDTSVPSLQLQVHVNASEWISPMVYQQEENAGFSDVQTAQIFSAYTNELLSSYSHQFQVLSSLNSALKCYWGKQLAALAKTKAEEAASVSAAATEVSGAGAATSKAKELYSWRDVSVQIPYSHLAKEALFNADSGVEMCEALIEDVRSFYSEAELCTQLFLSFVLHGTPSELKDYQQFVIAHAQDLACVPQAWQALPQALIKHCKSGVTLSRASFAQALAFLPEDDGAVAQWEQLQKEHSFICLTLTQCAETLQHILVFMGKVQMWINLFGLTVCNIKESYDETQNNLMTLLNAHPLNNRQHSAATAEDYREAFARRNDKKYISTGHKYLDAIIHGYYLGGVSILAAYSGTGKTWFGIDATVHALQ